MSLFVALNTISMGFLVALITFNMDIFVALKQKKITINLAISKNLTDQTFKTTELNMNLNILTKLLCKKETNLVMVPLSCRVFITNTLFSLSVDLKKTYNKKN